jgi:tripartite-type tricarboxylate transporter receptor subunit TctC
MNRIVLIAWAALAVAAAHAQQYPVRAVRLVIPSSPGGSSDVLGRLMSVKLSEAFGQQFVIDNRPGASGVIGVDYVAKAAPDGYTLLLSQTSLAINPGMFKKLPYDTLRDLAPVTQMVVGPNVLSAHPSLPVKSVKELIALARARPGMLIFGSPGIGTSPHLSVELFNVMAKVELTQVLYKGSGPAFIGVISGEIPLIMSSPPSVMPYLRANRLRVLGITTRERLASLPEAPSIADTLPGYEATQWFGILAPAATPRTIVERLHAEITRMLATPELRERMLGEGMTVVADTPDEFARHIRAETEKWAAVIKAANIKPE